MSSLKALASTISLAALLALFCACTASATNLCSVAPTGANECTAGKAYAPPEKFEAALEAKTKAEILGTLPVECTASTMTSELTKLEAGKLAVGKVKALAFAAGSCMSGGVACTLKAENLEYKTEWERSATMNGNGTQFIYALELKVDCGTVSCTYKAEEAKLEVKGGTVGKIIAPGGAATKMKKTVGLKPLCGEEAEWKATYLLTKPQPFWLTN